MGVQGSLADGLEAAATSGYTIRQDASSPAQVAGVHIQAANARGARNHFARNASFAGFAGMGRVGIGTGDKSGANALRLSPQSR